MSYVPETGYRTEQMSRDRRRVRHVWTTILAEIVCGVTLNMYIFAEGEA